ncbi:argininosuccinate lyase [Pseudenhygromyxa sp. WMMC2535]|uniref:argininosuccinate lyase n=1 Tax=Pseudenhygromyxa sp. WMMC2535 TaxID=2712867 RepID=UPI0015549F0C|nr:argininosuccinate lyase [Pseudenhygromyxa sp. WMMC2535]NVB40020.1 argininosuccinate lyase [Pseudenhygromyxa sp. WMMC2535]
MSSIARTEATGGALDPDFLAWQTSLPVDRRLLAVDVAGSVAHVEGLVAGGLLTREEGDTLQAALRSLPGRVARNEVELPLEEDVHMAVEVWLRATVGELADKLHTGRSRNDQVATDLKLWVREAIGRLLEALERLDVVCEDWIAEQGELAMPAYTHRQVAIPVLARLWIGAALRSPMARDRRLLAVVEEEIAESPLGAGAIAGNTLPIDPWVAARELGFTSPPQNPLDAVGSRDHALTLAFACARISQHLGRFCADVVELSADGLAKLGGAVACGSSMMPHKRNPDLFELVRGQAALRLGELNALMATFQGLGTGYHRDLQQDKQVLFASVDGTVDCLRMVALGIQHLRLDQAGCIAVLERGDAVATDLTEALVAGGVPFRQAYRKIGALVAGQRAKGKRLVDLETADLDAAGLPHSLLECLDVEASARRRASRYR